MGEQTVVVLDAANPLGSTLVDLLLFRGANVVAERPATDRIPVKGKGKLVSTFSKPPSFNNLIDVAVADFGNLDVLVNLVRLSSDPPFSDSTNAEWQSVLDGPLKAAYKSSQAAWAHFRSKGSGKIIHVFLGSGSANTNYSALKFGLYGLTKTSAQEGHKYDISSYLITSTAPNLLHLNDDGSVADAPNLHAVVETIATLGASKGPSDSGSLYEISGRNVAKLQWVRSNGALLKPDASLTPSAILARWDDVLKMSSSSFPAGSVDIADALKDISKLDANEQAQSISLVGQVAVVTGAGAGLGRAHALQIAKLGASVVVNDLKNAHRVVEEIRASGGKAVAHEGSATDGNNIVAKAIETFGRVDIIVNNAGFLRDKTVAKMQETSWDAVVDVHLNGMYQTAKAAWPHFLRQGGGRIVNTASTSGIYGFFGQANYSAAKLGIVGLADALAREGSKHNIVVNTIAPIAATSGLAGNIAAIPGGDPTPLKPEYISPLVALLSSPEARDLVTGGLFELVGGWHSRTMLQKSIETEVGGTPEGIVATWSPVTSLEHPLKILKSPEDILYENIKASKAEEVEILTYRYNDRDILLYNLSVGAKRHDLDLVFEDSPAFQPVPVYGIIPAVAPFLIYNNQNLVPNFSDRRALHGEHYLKILKHPIPLAGILKTYAKVLEVIDKGSAALVITALYTRDATTNENVFYNEATFFLRGSGGFGGPRTRQIGSPRHDHHHLHHPTAVSPPPPPQTKPPNRPPDLSITHKTSNEQAALYRLTGDRVGIHIDPTFSADAGFPYPILHGACTLGITGYHILRKYGRYTSIRNRFSGIVIPGQTLVIEMWCEQEEQPDCRLQGGGGGGSSTIIFFQTKVLETGKSCIEGGVAVLAEAEEEADSDSSLQQKQKQKQKL